MNSSHVHTSILLKCAYYKENATNVERPAAASRASLTFIPVVISESALIHPVIDSNQAEQLLMYDGTGRLGNVDSCVHHSGQVTAKPKTTHHYHYSHSTLEIYFHGLNQD